jgi:hypothetical protein
MLKMCPPPHPILMSLGLGEGIYEKGLEEKRKYEKGRKRQIGTGTVKGKLTL